MRFKAYSVKKKFRDEADYVIYADSYQDSRPIGKIYRKTSRNGNKHLVIYIFEEHLPQEVQEHERDGNLFPHGYRYLLNGHTRLSDQPAAAPDGDKDRGGGKGQTDN